MPGLGNDAVIGKSDEKTFKRKADSARIDSLWRRCVAREKSSYVLSSSKGYDAAVRCVEMNSINVVATRSAHASNQLFGDLLNNPLRLPLAALAIPVGDSKGSAQDHEGHKF